MRKNVNRREFLKDSLAGAIGLGLGVDALANRSAAAAGTVPKRRLGKTNEMVSIFSLGGYHMGRVKDEKEGIRMIRTAHDMGINFFDNAHLYHEGVSENRMGKGMVGIREDVLIMSKAMARPGKEYEKQLHESLTRMKTDYIDLYCFHDVRTKEDLDTIFGPKGALEVAVKAQKDGKIRFIGMTGHFDAFILAEGLKRWDGFAAMLMPINPMDPHYRSNLKIVVPKLIEKDVGVMAMKPIAAGNIFKNKIASIEECLRFVWSQPLTVAVSGCDSLQHMKENIQTAIDFVIMSQEEQEKLLARTEPHKGTDVEQFKRKA